MIENKEKDNNEEIISSDVCICCGRPIPEGSLVCFDCEEKSKDDLKRKSLFQKKWKKND